MPTPVDQQIAHHLHNILRLADLRKHLADDEHRAPLPIHGSARMDDRQPVAAQRWSVRNRPALARDHNRAVESCTNNEEGA
jgi:hypothetical protein